MSHVVEYVFYKNNTPEPILSALQGSFLSDKIDDISITIYKYKLAEKEKGFKTRLEEEGLGLSRRPALDKESYVKLLNEYETASSKEIMLDLSEEEAANIINSYIRYLVNEYKGNEDSFTYPHKIIIPCLPMPTDKTNNDESNYSITIDVIENEATSINKKRKPNLFKRILNWIITII